MVAQGVFEYMGEFQRQKFAEIAEVLDRNGTFIVSYVNFGHRDREVYWPYNNMQPIEGASSAMYAGISPSSGASQPLTTGAILSPTGEF